LRGAARAAIVAARFDEARKIKMRAVRSIVVVFAALAALTLVGAPAHAQGIYAALAISPGTGAYGFGYNYDTEAGARDRAMMECRKHAQDCRVHRTFSRQCISIARATNNAFGVAIGFPNDERPERALNDCAANNGGDCKILTQFCSGT
jgi:hypothetical protein